MPELDLAWFKANIAESAEAGIMVPLHPEFGNKLVAEIERLRTELKEDQDRSRRLLKTAQVYESEKYPACIDRAELAEREVERLRAALEQYADVGNWATIETVNEDYPYHDWWQEPGDGFTVALAALRGNDAEKV